MAASHPDLPSGERLIFCLWLQEPGMPAGS